MVSLMLENTVTETVLFVPVYNGSCLKNKMGNKPQHKLFKLVLKRGPPRLSE